MAGKVPQIALAYDRSTFTLNESYLLKELEPEIGLLKLGLESITAPYIDETDPSRSVGSVAERILRNDKWSRWSIKKEKVVLDIKINDISNTIRGAVRNLCGRVGGATIHASVGPSGLAAAAKARQEVLGGRAGVSPDDTLPWTTLFGVTVLTSLEDECENIFGEKPGPKVLQFARDCADNGIDGLVCSGKELGLLREHGLADKFTTFVPGGRPTWAAAGDQKRVVTPAELALLGADYVVIGRPILGGHPYKPLEAAQRIRFEMEDAIAKAA